MKFTYKVAAMKYPGERYEKANLLRNSGLTYREVGVRLGVSPSRAREMFKKYERWVNRSSNIPEESTENLDIPVSVANTLKAAGVINTSDLEKYSGKDLLEIPNFGEKALSSIRSALKKIGRHDMKCLHGEEKPDPQINQDLAEKYIKYLNRFGYEVKPPRGEL